jgi:2-amino-4-hydroxy-6-hydroxymethyldihydropteridine diphosphokinase
VDRIAPQLAAIAIGSNLGDRHAHLAFARTRLESLLVDLQFSAIRDTEPVGVPDRQPPYLNAVAAGTTDASPRDLLEALLAIERERGRERPYPNAPRTLDLDLLLVGDLVVDEPDLLLPHPRLTGRLFVLEPLLDIDRIRLAWRHPITRQTVAEMIEALRPSLRAPSTTPR